MAIDQFYVDEAKKWGFGREKALEKLIRASKAGKVKAIIVSSLDRLSRDLRFAENLFFDLQGIGIEIFIADMPHYDGNKSKRCANKTDWGGYC